MPFQLAQFNTLVIAFSTFVRFFMGMPVPHMPHQFTRGCKISIAKLAPMRFGPSMGIYMVLQRC